MDEKRAVSNAEIEILAEAVTRLYCPDGNAAADLMLRAAEAGEDLKDQISKITFAIRFAFKEGVRQAARTIWLNEGEKEICGITEEILSEL